MHNIQLWHAKNPTFEVPPMLPTNINGQWKHICDFGITADTEEQAMEKVFQQSQNLKENWGTGEDRSTSVGDIMIVTNAHGIGLKVFVVAPCGFNHFE